MGGGATKRAALHEGHSVFIVVFNNSLALKLTVVETCTVQWTGYQFSHHLLSRRWPMSRAHTCASCCEMNGATEQLGTTLAPQWLSADQTAPIRTNGLHTCVPPSSELRNFHAHSKRPQSLRRRTVTYFEVRRKFDRSADRPSRETKWANVVVTTTTTTTTTTAPYVTAECAGFVAGCAAHILRSFRELAFTKCAHLYWMCNFEDLLSVWNCTSINIQKLS
jgi:hypothetical protein